MPRRCGFHSSARVEVIARREEIETGLLGRNLDVDELRNRELLVGEQEADHLASDCIRGLLGGLARCCGRGESA